ncbi:MAG: hypothetical protein OXF46_01370 [Rhodobacteraceae bacterium]|nr:hypothetical protein [Paracoccaceae bacterium]
MIRNIPIYVPDMFGLVMPEPGLSQSQESSSLISLRVRNLEVGRIGMTIGKSNVSAMNNRLGISVFHGMANFLDSTKRAIIDPGILAGSSNSNNPIISFLTPPKKF